MAENMKTKDAEKVNEETLENSDKEENPKDWFVGDLLPSNAGNREGEASWEDYDRAANEAVENAEPLVQSQNEGKSSR